LPRALAADLAVKPMYSKAPAVAPVDNWSGFHIGAMGDYGKENTSDVGASAGGPELLTVNDKINDLGTFRGRVGFAFNQFLFYRTGGFAWADNNCRPRCSA
jgi:outer membrane immunogenic protein